MTGKPFIIFPGFPGAVGTLHKNLGISQAIVHKFQSSVPGDKTYATLCDSFWNSKLLVALFQTL